MNIRNRIKKLLLSEKQIRASIIFAITVLVLIVLVTFTPLNNTMSSIQSSFYWVGQNIGSTWRRVFTSENSTQNKLKKAEESLNALAVEKSYLESLESQVQELQSLLGYQQEINKKAIPAKIIARSIDSTNEILIDKGADDGIRQELAVIVGNGHMIGKILEVQKNSSKVLLLKDPGSKIATKILGAQSTMGLVEGDGGFLLKMSYIPQSYTVKEGDMVVTSGLDGHIEPGLVVGIINEVIRVDTSQFVEAHIEPIVDPRNYSNVLVIDPIFEIEKYD